MRLIDADAEIERNDMEYEMFLATRQRLSDEVREISQESFVNHVTSTVHENINLVLAKAKTIDAVEVVRCKDCKWCKRKKTALGERMLECELLCIDTQPEAYCSFGERRERHADKSILQLWERKESERNEDTENGQRCSEA